MAVQFPKKNTNNPSTPTKIAQKTLFPGDFWLLIKCMRKNNNSPMDSTSFDTKFLFGALISRKMWANIPNDAIQIVEPHA